MIVCVGVGVFIVCLMLIWEGGVEVVVLLVVGLCEMVMFGLVVYVLSLLVVCMLVVDVGYLECCVVDVVVFIFICVSVFVVS